MKERIEEIKQKIEMKHLKMNPPISEYEIKAIEEEYKIVLPQEYKSFITQVGNGGGGPPYYGMLSLQESIKFSVDSADGSKNVLANEFPFVEYWVWEDEENTTEVMKKREQVGYGNLVLGEEGCGQCWSLIITGQEKGQIWNFADVGIQPCAPKLSFLDWYEYWLDGGKDWWAGFSC